VQNDDERWRTPFNKLRAFRIAPAALSLAAQPEWMDFGYGSSDRDVIFNIWEQLDWYSRDSSQH
jgi:hypothetical protein